MDPKVQDILIKAAAYVETAQPVIDRYNEQRSAFVERATKTAGVLAKHGVMDQRRVNAFVDKVAEDPTAVWDVIEKLASLVGTDQLGAVSTVKSAEGDEADPFARRFFGSNIDSQSGMID